MTPRERDNDTRSSRKRLQASAAVAVGPDTSVNLRALANPLNLNSCQGKSTPSSCTAVQALGQPANSRPTQSGSGPGGGGVFGAPQRPNPSTPTGTEHPAGTRYICRRCLTWNAGTYAALDLDSYDGVRFLKLFEPNHCEVCARFCSVLAFRIRGAA